MTKAEQLFVLHAPFARLVGSLEAALEEGLTSNDLALAVGLAVQRQQRQAFLRWLDEEGIDYGRSTRPPERGGEPDGNM